MSDASALTRVGTVTLNSKDAVCVDLDVYGGRQVFSVRKWFKADGDKLLPTSKGITVATVHLPMLAKLVTDALAQARAEGRLPHDGGPR